MRVVSYFHDGDGNLTYLMGDENAGTGMLYFFQPSGSSIKYEGSAVGAMNMFIEDGMEFLSPINLAKFDDFAAAVGVGPAPEPEPEPEPDPEEED